jgi:hypothetical protein
MDNKGISYGNVDLQELSVEQSAGLHYHIIKQQDPVLKYHIHVGLLQSVCLGNSSSSMHKAVTVKFVDAR